MELYNWEQVPDEQMTPQVVRKVIHSAQMTIARLRLQKGAALPEHSHVNEQIATVEKGALRFRIAGEERILRAGESVVLPPNVPHGAEALEDTIATDVFSPRREDWIKGDSGYLPR
jgi:quercetin dioxygenase-like cupin family protein